MNDVRTVEQLEEALRTRSDEDRLEPGRLAQIRTGGRRRRRLALAAGAVGTATAVAALSVGAAVLNDRIGATDDGGTDTRVAKEEGAPKVLSPLAQRALAEIPGAVQVSAWQVVIPAPADARAPVASSPVPLDHVAAGPVDIGTRHYTGVTSFRARDFPDWLYDGTEDYEQNVLGDEESGYPVGSTETGVVVDAGQLRLACMTPLPEWGGDESEGCFPAMLSGADDGLVYEWGMGTDDFLDPGADLELFHDETFVDGSAALVWIGGTDGTDVASVDLVDTDGDVVQATVAPGTLVPGETMFWGTVDGDLAQAVTRDADGQVLEDHEVQPCSDPVDCEVR